MKKEFKTKNIVYCIQKTFNSILKNGVNPLLGSNSRLLFLCNSSHLYEVHQLIKYPYEIHLDKSLLCNLCLFYFYWLPFDIFRFFKDFDHK